MDLNSLSIATSISQWTLFLGIGFLIFGIIEKREHYILAGQIAFVMLGFFAIWILFPKGHYALAENPERLTKDLKSLAFFKGAVVFMGLTFITLALKLLKHRYQKFSIYILLFFALILFFMLVNIIQMPTIQQ